MSNNPLNVPPYAVPPDYDYNDLPLIHVQYYPFSTVPPYYYYNGQLAPPYYYYNGQLAPPYYYYNGQLVPVQHHPPPHIPLDVPVLGHPYVPRNVPNQNINAQQPPNVNVVQRPNLNVQCNSPYHVTSYPLEQAPMLQKVWAENYLTFGYQKLFRDLIDCIAQLEEDGIMNGFLNNDYVSIIDGHAKITKIPKKPHQNLPTFREELRRLASDKLGDYMAANSQRLQLELWSFYELLEYKLPRFNFRQLMYHPLLQSASERCYFRLRSSIHIHYRPNKNGWIAKFRNMRRNVNIAGIFGHKENVGQLPEDKRPFATLYHNWNYEQNAYALQENRL